MSAESPMLPLRLVHRSLAAWASGRAILRAGLQLQTSPAY